MKIVYISTLGHNPGDDFIRYGLEYLMEKIYPGHEHLYIHKHDPRSIYSSWDTIPLPKTLNRSLVPFQLKLYEKYKGKNIGLDKILDSDMVVIAGTPFIWRQNTKIYPSKCSNAEWIKPVWRRISSIYNKVPFLILAVGSSLPAGKDADWLLQDKKCVDFLLQSAKMARLVTVRDKIAHEIFNKIGVKSNLIPCTSILSGKKYGILPQKGDYVCINYMRGGVHSSRGYNNRSVQKWRTCLLEVLDELRLNHNIRFIAHSVREYENAKQDFPVENIFYSPDPRELLKFYSHAIFGLVNRIHSAGGLAACGKPSFCIGGDSRMSVVEMFGMEYVDVHDAQPQTIVNKLHDMESSLGQQEKNIIDLQNKTESLYLELLKDVLMGKG